MRTITGRIRSRLLINTVVDPDDAARCLPAGVQPHITAEGTVVGCCFLDLAEVGPGCAPFGLRIRAAANRISVEWRDPCGNPVVGVYVPTRLTDALPARAAGGRLFPGVHERATVDLRDENGRVAWSVTPHDSSSRFAATVLARPIGEAGACDPVGGVCLDALVGLSPDRHGKLEGARMAPSHRNAQRVEVESFRSAFVDQFTSAKPAPSYLVRDAAVVWTREPALAAWSAA